MNAYARATLIYGTAIGVANRDFTVGFAIHGNGLRARDIDLRRSCQRGGAAWRVWAHRTVWCRGWRRAAGYAGGHHTDGSDTYPAGAFVKANGRALPRARMKDWGAAHDLPV